MRLDAHGLFTPLRTICWNLRAGLVLVIVVLLSSPSVFGQGIVTGMISGTVMDAQGAVVAGATVQSTHVATAAKLDRKSTRLNSSHQIISYAVFCLKKKIAPGEPQDMTAKVADR